MLLAITLKERENIKEIDSSRLSISQAASANQKAANDISHERREEVAPWPH